MEVENSQAQNPVKRMKNNLGINRYTIIDILNIIRYSHNKNDLIKGVKKHNPCQGDRVMVYGKLG